MNSNGNVQHIKFAECDRQEPESLTDLCSGNTLHLGGQHLGLYHCLL